MATQPKRAKQNVTQNQIGEVKLNESEIRI